MKKESLIQVMLLIASLAAPGMASDYLLDIFGNANLDQDIDEKDAAYVEGIIKGTNPATNLSDANYDGKIDAQDIDHINRIILGEETELTLVDSLDRIVTVKKPINHAVVGIRNLLEMFQTIHVDSEHISGITASSNAEYNNLFLPDYIDIPAVGSSSWNLDIEAVLNQHPDVVFLNRGSQLDPISDELESMNIPVLRFYGGTYSEDIEKEMKAFGYLFDKRDEAEKFIDWYESFITAINTTVSKIPDEDRPTVWFESSHKMYYGFNENLVDFAGGKNILPGGGDIDPEAVVGFDPDVIIIASGCTGGYFQDADNVTAIKKLRDEMMSRSELQNVSAVKNGRVYAINGYMLGSMSCSSGRSFLQVPYLAAWFYPELFKDLDPQAIHQEYLTKFRGLNYDLDKEGVFVYPPLEES